MATQAPPPAASRYYAASALAATQAGRLALDARPAGAGAIWRILQAFQVAQAQFAQEAVGTMLAQQDLDIPADALLRPAAFTTERRRFEEMIEQAAYDWQFARIIASLTQDAARAAEGVAVATHADIGHVRMLTPPSCSRCAVLAGRVYRYSEGFLRHPGCDCVMIPTTLANRDYNQDPVDLMERGLVTGLSKADRRAIADGADFNQVVNVRLKEAGMSESGRVLYRAGRPTPEAIYRSTNSREEALDALQRAGYLR